MFSPRASPSPSLLPARSTGAAGLPRDELPALGGYELCCAADGALEPGGALLCLEPPVSRSSGDGGDGDEGGARSGDGGEGGEKRGGGGAGAAETPASPWPPPVACVACVIGPGGGLTLWLPKEERAGLLELLEGDNQRMVGNEGTGENERAREGELLEEA